MTFYPNSNKEVNANYIPPASTRRLFDANGITAQLAKNAGHLLHTENDDYSIGRARGIMDAVDLINKSPVVDLANTTEIVHAKWVYDGKYNEWLCSHCNGRILNEVEVYGGGMYRDINTVYSPYCPWCGAIMDGGN